MYENIIFKGKVAKTRALRYFWGMIVYKSETNFRSLYVSTFYTCYFDSFFLLLFGPLPPNAMIESALNSSAFQEDVQSNRSNTGFDLVDCQLEDVSLSDGDQPMHRSFLDILSGFRFHSTLLGHCFRVNGARKVCDVKEREELMIRLISLWLTIGCCRKTKGKSSVKFSFLMQKKKNHDALAYLRSIVYPSISRYCI